MPDEKQPLVPNAPMTAPADHAAALPPEEQQPDLPMFIAPVLGERITSTTTGNTYWIGERIGGGNFGDVYHCIDSWDNKLAIKVLKPKDTYENIRQQAIAEYGKLMRLRHPQITYVHDAFEYRQAFYIVVERCMSSINELMAQVDDFKGEIWLRPIARNLLQAVHFIHINNYAHQDIHGGNVLYAWIEDAMRPENISAITFKLADLGITKLVPEMDATNTVLAEWMRAPEALKPQEFGPMDQRMDIYHCGLLFLQILLGRPLTFTAEQVLAGAPRAEALKIGPPYSFALEKALRRHVQYRTSTAMELWRDLNTPVHA